MGELDRFIRSEESGQFPDFSFKPKTFLRVAGALLAASSVVSCASASERPIITHSPIPTRESTLPNPSQLIDNVVNNPEQYFTKNQIIDLGPIPSSQFALISKVSMQGTEMITDRYNVFYEDANGKKVNGLGLIGGIANHDGTQHLIFLVDETTPPQEEAKRMSDSLALEELSKGAIFDLKGKIVKLSDPEMIKALQTNYILLVTSATVGIGLPLPSGILAPLPSPSPKFQ